VPQGDTQKIGKMLESAMMQKVGPAALKQHFMIMDTICDATQERQDAVFDLVGKQDQVLILHIDILVIQAFSSKLKKATMKGQNFVCDLVGKQDQVPPAAP